MCVCVFHSGWGGMAFISYHWPMGLLKPILVRHGMAQCSGFQYIACGPLDIPEIVSVSP